MFDLFFRIALIIFVLGLVYQMASWFLRRIGFFAARISPTQRLAAAAAAGVRTLFSPKIVCLFKALLLDVCLQQRVFREDRWRWLAHMLMFYGFTLLLLMHALQSVISENLFGDYYATVNPFFFLRDFFGVLVLAGAVLVVVRRYVFKPRRLRTNSRDHVAIALLAAILLSGFMLEGLKITAYSEFQRMVEDYAGLDDEDEIRALEALWRKEFGLVAAHGPQVLDEAEIEAGREIHELNCADCHAPAQYAFVGFATARLITPVAGWLDRMGAVSILWHLHFIACFAGLAYLPFSKMFHLLATPVSLVVNRLMDPETADPANVLTRQIIELDACTHCGSCSLHCSAAMMFAAMGNENILPSEKMTALRHLVSGRKLDAHQRQRLLEGVYVCTNCDRCTVRCPSGIRLKELWYSVREQLLHDCRPPPAVLSPFSFARGLVIQSRLASAAYDGPLTAAIEQVGAAGAPDSGATAPIVLNADPKRPPTPEPETASFRHCFSCQTCTTVCPVVADYETPEKALGLLPHQIMCCLGLGLKDMAAGAKMIWDCLTCYQCQENCPQQVDVCDLLFALKNRAVSANGYPR